MLTRAGLPPGDALKYELERFTVYSPTDEAPGTLQRIKADAVALKSSKRSEAMTKQSKPSEQAVHDEVDVPRRMLHAPPTSHKPKGRPARKRAAEKPSAAGALMPKPADSKPWRRPQLSEPLAQEGRGAGRERYPAPSARPVETP